MKQRSKANQTFSKHSRISPKFRKFIPWQSKDSDTWTIDLANILTTAKDASQLQDLALLIPASKTTEIVKYLVQPITESQAGPKLWTEI